MTAEPTQDKWPAQLLTNLVDLYVINTQKGTVENLHGYELPSHLYETGVGSNKKTVTVRHWFCLEKRQVVNDETTVGWLLAFDNIERTTQWLERWANEKRATVANAYKWLAANAGIPQERARRKAP